MTILATLALFCYIPLILIFFASMPPRRAVIVGLLAAWLFLPNAECRIVGLLRYNKATATSLGVLLGVLLFDLSRFLRLRPRWIDLPMAVWCLCSFASSISNDLGTYDGLSAVFYTSLMWGVPYVIGRMYFDNSSGLRELALGILIGALLYVPLCLVELRLSPQLHRWVYGFHQHAFRQHIRDEGYRPMVFMENCLALGIWMTAASLIGIWFWITGTAKRVCGVRMRVLVPILVVTSVLGKTFGATILLGVGAGTLALKKWARSSLALWSLLVLPPCYMVARASQLLPGRDLVEFARVFSGDERAESLEARVIQEDLFSAKARQRAVFGWGGWDRMFPTDELTGARLTRGIDSLWIIAMGSTGLVGLISWLLLMSLPPALLLWRRPASEWLSPSGAAAGVLAVVLMLYTIYCLFNGMLNPIFVSVVGGLSGFVSNPVPAARTRHPRVVATSEERTLQTP